jgi:hypothetical protein
MVEEMNVEGILAIKTLSQGIPGGTEEKTTERPIKIANDPAEIRTQHLSNTS